MKMSEKYFKNSYDSRNDELPNKVLEHL